MREPVEAHDAVWLQETAANLMVINAVFISDRLDTATVSEAFRQRVIEADGGRKYPRFRRRITWAGGDPYWEDDPDFDLARHIIPAHEADLTTTDKLQRYVGAEASRPLPDDRPRWQFQVVENFEEGGSACIIRIHHSMGDGVSLVAVIFSFMEELTGPDSGSAPAEIRPASGAPGRDLLKLIRIPLAAPKVLIQRMLWPRDSHALHGPKVSGNKQVAWTTPFDIEVLKDVKNRLGATVNDVLMACVSGALSHYIQRRAGQVVRKLRVLMPVNIRPPNEPLSMGNRFAAVPLVLPASIADVRERVAAVKQRMDALKRSVEPIAVYGIQSVLLTLLPQAASKVLLDFYANKCTAVVTNVPGPQRGLAGRRVRSMMFWVPQRADVAVGISILSFAGKVQVGVIADARLVPDARDLARAFEEEFQALRGV
jgi:diacylglycerol O-acyltransferase / wax synthase